MNLFISVVLMFSCCLQMNAQSPPDPPVNPDLKKEEDALQAQRQQKIDNLVSVLATTCSISEEERIIMQLKVEPNGDIVFYDLLRHESIERKKIACIDKVMKDKPINVGEIKVLTGARSRGRPADVLYTLLIK